MPFVSALLPGETVVLDERVCLTYVQTLWFNARVRLTNQRLLWEPFEDFLCEMRIDQIEHVSSRALVVLTHTVIKGKDGTEIAVAARGRALPDALNKFLAES